MAVHNHLLFSEIFFRQVRSEATDLDNLKATLSTIRDTWQYYLAPPAEWDGPAWMPADPLPPDEVPQLRAKVVEQIFAYLELTYGPCDADERAFLLYADWGREDQTGLCLVLPYSANIEGRHPETGIIPKGHNYAQQLIRLLRQHDLDWGVLTNGRHWRLLHRTELSPTETYLHVDLERIIAADDMEDYIVFHRFFSRPAFARREGHQRLDLYKQQSDEAAKVIEDHLSSQVEEIAQQLCQGLVESCRTAGEDITASDTRAAIYRNALFLVYRLLFVLYAEARHLLPLDAPTYRAVCLHDLLAEVLDNHKLGMRYDDDYVMWNGLQALFALIDQGDAAAGVPAYNGGLFDPSRRSFLTEHSIPNDYLQAALIRLSTLPAKGRSYDQDREPQPIDYRDLSVRHLGSLYEGLLEYNLFVVEDEPHVVRVSKKKTKYVPYSQAGKVRASEMVLPVGDVYFSETAGERKATGSYYTPEDIVDYIVRNTVGTKLTQLKAEFYETREIEHQLADLADTPLDIPAHRQIQESLDDQFLRFVREKALDLKILDPAMGSGHFLVNATHAMANFIVELLNETPWENYEIDTDVATWKREVAERCIFGVDLNELAVELAKLCLWMTTTAKGKPLTFLDHHLRRGDSVVGSWLAEAGIDPRAKKESEHAFTLPLERFRVCLDRVWASYKELYARSSDNVDGVRDKARIFDEEIYAALLPYRELLNLHTGVHFGNRLDETTYARLGAAVSNMDMWEQLKAVELGDLLSEHDSQQWFHWELEFPEVFQGEDKKVGFDVVLGNPPYFTLPQSRFTRSAYGHVIHGVVNVASLLVARALDLLRDGGYLGYLLPKSVLRVQSYAALRDHLLQYRVDLLGDFGLLFKDVRGEQIVLRLQNAPHGTAHGSITIDVRSAGKKVDSYQISRRFLKACGCWPTQITELDERIFWKLQGGATELRQIASIFRGIPVGANSPLVSKVRRSPDDLPVLRGESIGRYRLRHIWWLDREALDRMPPRTIARFTPNRIVVQNMFSREAGPIATIDTTGMVTLDTVTNIVPHDQESYAYILGILNSKVSYYFLVQFVFAQSYLTMHMDSPYVGRIPIRQAAAPDQLQLESRIAEIALELHDPSVNVNTPVWEKLATDLDRLAFQLYDLSPTEIDRIFVAIRPRK